MDHDKNYCRKIRPAKSLKFTVSSQSGKKTRVSCLGPIPTVSKVLSFFLIVDISTQKVENPFIRGLNVCRDVFSFFHI